MAVEPKPQWSRRRWIVWAGMSAAGAAVALIGAVRAGGYALAPALSSKLRVFGPAHYSLVTAFAERILAPYRCDAASFADTYIAELPRKDRRDVMRFIVYVEHFAPMAAGHLRRFTNLDARARDDVIASLELSDSPLIHVGFRALRDLAFMAYYRSAASWGALGYPGPRIVWGSE